MADSHALGAHWVYDAGKLAELGDIRDLRDPACKFHPNRKVRKKEEGRRRREEEEEE